MDEVILTQEGLEKIKAELVVRLKKRKEIANTIEYAKGLGDLSENFEYQEAKEDQAFNESRIMELEEFVKRAVIFEDKKKGIVNLGSSIKVKSEGSIKEFIIVSFNEADPLNNKISNESPLGRAFWGKKVGDKVEVNVPKGKITFEIIDVI